MAVTVIMKAPTGITTVFIDGTRFDADANGHINCPVLHVQDLLQAGWVQATLTVENIVVQDEIDALVAQFTTAQAMTFTSTTIHAGTVLALE